MTWDPERDEDSWEEYDSVDEPAPKVRPEQRPAIWPVFVVFVGALVVAFGLQIVLLAALAIWLLVDGTKLENLGNVYMDAMMSPGFFGVLAVASQLGFAGGAVVGGWFSPQGVVKSLGLGRPRVPWFTLPILIIGALAPAALGALAASGVSHLLPDESPFDEVFRRLTLSTFVPFALLIALAPGFAEEMLFRGYMQRRLLLRLSPWTVIFISSALFGLAHFYPPQVVFAFTLGIWLGVVAWRTGSIWPGICAHAVWNTIAVTMSVSERLFDIPEEPPLVPSIILGAIVFGCFLASVWVLARVTPPTPDDDIVVVELAPD